MSATATSALVPEILNEYGELTRAKLREYLPTCEPRRHLYDLVSDYPLRGGKMMRPSLCIATARAFGAGIDDALDTAVAIELLHNALLIHDDIEDGSEQRRGRPTLHVEHGIPLALNAGDTLTLVSLRPLIANRNRLGGEIAMKIMKESERMALASAEGQALELGWRKDNVLDLDEADYLRMVLKKTCWLATIFPVRVGALIGSRGAADLDSFMHFGFFLGATFQIQDDLLNLVADRKYGKERDGDLWEGKRTLMLIRLFRELPPADRDRLKTIMRGSRTERMAEDVAWIRAEMDHHGCIDYARRHAHWLAGVALHEYSVAFSHLPDSRDKRFIEEMVTWVVERN
ncbi:MAG TPA: polyprenyl synthetase family protein [Candidatus Binataceae bacterium]|jgi:geranylgeranyl diphosphate synthase type II